MKLNRRKIDSLTSFAFVLPLLLLFLVFFAYPIIYNIIISFYDWNGISLTKTFSGLANYKNCWRILLCGNVSATSSGLQFQPPLFSRQSVLSWLLFYKKNKAIRILQNPVLFAGYLYTDYYRNCFLKDI